LINNPEKLREFLKKSRTRKNKKPEEKMIDLVRDGFKLGYALAGKNTTEFENKNMKFISPRFMSVVPEQKQKDEVSYTN
jgi:hypothetical protein